MSSFRQRLPSLLVIIILLFNSVILAEDDDAQIDKFYVINTDDPATGGCTPDQVLKVKAAYTEAMKMVRGAMSDIDTFNAPRSKDNKADQNQYDKVFGMLAQIFGIRTVDGEAGGPRDPGERDRLGEARKVFESLQSRADGPVPADFNERKLIFCNNKGVTYLRNSDRIPWGRGADQLVSVLRAPHGIFFQPGKYDEKGVQITREMLIAAPPPKIPGGTPRVEDTICRPTVGATTERFSGRIFLCPKFFEKRPRVLPSQYVSKGLKLDFCYGTSMTMLHELVHLWNPIRDLKAVDMSPNLGHPRPRLDVPVYFFDRCYDLADNYPGDTVKTADTYAIFAAGQFYRNWIWVTDKADNGKLEKGLAWPIDQPYTPPTT